MRRAAFSILVLLSAQGVLPLAEAAGKRASSFDQPPPILSRAQWGADESLGILQKSVTVEGKKKPAASPPGDEEPGELSEREKKCQELLQKYPEEFHQGTVITKTAQGERYLWPRQLSTKVKLLVIHHTGESERPDGENELSGIDHVRAIYQWHTVHNGWGDIGYHYLIDKDGKIYEGRAGGKDVVGAHTYCANTGTIGIALLGNFEHEHPTEEQLSSLRRLLAYLSDEYGVNPRGKTLFHGSFVPTIVAHRDISLNKTACAGEIIEELLPAIRRLVALKDFTSAMLPKPQQEENVPLQTRALLPKGSTHLRLPPRGAARIELVYQAPKELMQGTSIADIQRSDQGIELWQTRESERLRIGEGIRIERSLQRSEQLNISLTVLAPEDAGTYTLQIGAITYVLDVSGKRARNDSSTHAR